MTPTIGSSLLAAAMLLGQTTDAQVIQQPGSGKIVEGSIVPYQPTQQAPRGIFSWFSSPDRPVLSRIHNWFHPKDQQQEPPLQQPYRQPMRGTIIEGTPTSNPLIAPAGPGPTDYPRKMPSPSGKDLSFNTEPELIQQTSLTLAGKSTSPILPQLAKHIGRDEKFEWITGQLEIERGSFVLYYATPDTVDTYHGRIVIQPQKVDMQQFRRGDLISVRGDVIQTQTPQGPAPVYRVSFASLIERVK
jgi:hypothetical protein